jgi:RNA polymerase sigma factor (sigma-70 family)
MWQMTDAQSQIDQFESHRPHLMAVATRLLGPGTEADDAVQETWLRFDQVDTATIGNPGGWLTTVVSRICLDQLRTRTRWSEESVDQGDTDIGDDEPGPEDAAILAEASSEALGIVLDSLTPIERVAFVLHDVFAVPFDDVAAVIDRSPVATRQLASRARRKVCDAARDETMTLNPQRDIVIAFFTAAREGRMADMLRVLAPGVVLRPDAMVQMMGAEPRTGQSAVAENFFGGAIAARFATIDGQFGAMWSSGGQIQVVFLFTVKADEIVAIDMIGDQDAIAIMEIEPVIARRRTANTSEPVK